MFLLNILQLPELVEQFLLGAVDFVVAFVVAGYLRCGKRTGLYCCSRVYFIEFLVMAGCINFDGKLSPREMHKHTFSL